MNLIPVSFDNWQFKTQDFDEEADGCQSIVFYNRGAVTCTINRLPLDPNNYIEYKVEPGEMDVTTYSCSFQGEGNKQLWFLKKKIVTI
jgi:hypothetical protein